MDNFHALLIDDEEELVSTLAERLGYRGVDAEYVLSGSEALKKLRLNKYDIIVLDLKMPGMSGFEVMKKIKFEHPYIPILLITGHGSAANQTEKIPEDVYDCLPKPIKLETLIEKMREAIQNK